MPFSRLISRYLLTYFAVTAAWSYQNQPSSEVYVSSAGVVFSLSEDGSLLRKIDSGLPTCTGIAFDSSGLLYLRGPASGPGVKMDRLGRRLGEFDGAHRTIARPAQKTLPFLNPAANPLANPTGLGRLPLGEFGNTGGPEAVNAWRRLDSQQILALDGNTVLRLNSMGMLLASYHSPNPGPLLTLSIDPDGSSFWTADPQTGEIFQFDLNSTKLLRSIDTSRLGLPATASGHRIDALAIYSPNVSIPLPKADTQTVVLTFEGLRDDEPVLDFYNNGRGGLGSGPGANYGIRFNPDALAIVSGSQGGDGNFEGQPSGKTVLYFLTGSAATMNVPTGFSTGFSFFYSSPYLPGSIVVWSGPDSTGTILTSLNLPTTPSRTSNPSVCSGSYEYCPFTALGVSFSGVARSVDFGGTINKIGFDNITLGTSVAAASSLTSIAPNSATAGAAALQLTLIGTGFTTSSRAFWNSTALVTSYVSSTQLTASVPASLLASSGAFNVTVSTNSSSSNPIAFTVNPSALPALTAISPSSAVAGSPTFTLTVAGNNFPSASTVNWGSTPLVTTFVSPSQLTAVVPANLLTTAAQVSISVLIPGGGATSALVFTIAPAGSSGGGSSGPAPGLGIVTSLDYPNFASVAGLTLNGRAARVSTPDGFILRLATATPFNSGSAFSTSLINAGAFSTSFSFRMGQGGGLDGGADGIVFVVQPVSDGLGSDGGGIGYLGITPSVAVEFDCYQNPWDANNSHVAILVNGSVENHRALYTTPTPLLDGNIRYVWIDYDGTNLEVRLNTSNVRPAGFNLRYAINIPSTLRQNIAYAGFTAGTGNGWANHDILSWRLNSSITSGPVLVSSNWESSGLDGWTFVNDGTDLIRVPVGGNPGGFLQAKDVGAGNTLYFSAPQKFLGNQSAAYKGALSFDLQQSTLSGQFNDEDVILSGGGLTLYFDLPANPALAPLWRNYSIPLVASAGWRLGSSFGLAATEAQMQAVLASITSIQIRAEYSNLIDTDGIDNVILSGPPIIAQAVGPNSIQVSGIANAADFSTSVAPGSLASLFGANLSTSIASPTSLPIPTSLAGVTVSVNGRPAPITYLSPTQINFQIPAATSPGPASLVINAPNQISSPFSFTVSTNAPGIFQYGTNRAIAVNQDSTLNSPEQPAPSGSTIVLYLTGIGLTSPGVADGAASPVGPLALAQGSYSAFIAGIPAPVIFLGLTPGFVGLAQANIQIPILPSGNYALSLSLNGQTSRSALITVRGPATPPAASNFTRLHPAP